jgi:integrase
MAEQRVWLTCVVMPKYLQKRRRRWYAILDVPENLQKILGIRFIQSLKTESLTEAERLVLPVIARWKAEIEAVRTGTSTPLDVLAQQWARDLAAAPDEEMRFIYTDLLDEKTKELQLHSPEMANTFRKVVTGETVDLSLFLEEWLSGLEDAPKTIDMKRSDVKRFLQTFRHSHQVNKRAVQKWAHDFQRDEDITATTARRRISACKGYWEFLQRSGRINREDAPFDGAVEKRKGKSKAAYDGRRKHFTAEEVVKHLNAAEASEDLQLRDLIWLGMWTGCRIEEVCSLRVEDVKETHFRVVDGKTEAGNRQVPIHPRLAPALANHCSVSRDGYVLEGLSFNKYGDRSNAIGKRFGRLKRRLGFGRDLVFHSIRKTVATQLENAGIGENVTADILGHDKQTITYGLYSGGSSLEVMQRAIETLSYPELQD